MARSVSDSRHPLAKGKFTCLTPPMNEFCASIRGALEFNLAGLLASGSPRVGKSTTVRYIAENPKSTLGRPIKVFLHSCRVNPKRTLTELALVSQLLTSLDQKLATTGDRDKRWKRLIAALEEMAARSYARRLVIIIDEANLLAYEELQLLITIQNALETAGVSPLFVLVGQTQLATRRMEFLAEGAMQIIGRFMSTHISFTGLRTVDDVRYCSRQFDEKLMWRGKSFSQFYGESAFNKGWRLESHAEELWAEFYRLGQAQAGDYELSMQSFCGVIRYLLRVKAGRKPDFQCFSSDDIVEAIECVGYLEFPHAA